MYSDSSYSMEIIWLEVWRRGGSLDGTQKKWFLNNLLLLFVCKLYSDKYNVFWKITFELPLS
jgi:hypothetical protein